MSYLVILSYLILLHSFFSFFPQTATNPHCPFYSVWNFSFNGGDLYVEICADLWLSQVFLQKQLEAAIEETFSQNPEQP